MSGSGIPRRFAISLERVEAEVKLLPADLTEEIWIKRAGRVAEERRIANDIGFIGNGTGVRALIGTRALADAGTDPAPPS